MEKLEKFDEVWTAGYGFTVELFRDSERGEFVAQMVGFTPRLAVQTEPGEPVTYMKSVGPKEIRDSDRDKLIERCRKWIEEVDGEIIRWD